MFEVEVYVWETELYTANYLWQLGTSL